MHSLVGILMTLYIRPRHAEVIFEKNGKKANYIPKIGQITNGKSSIP
jgi:hypothetical protein